jgi:FkbM family methyltransferase
MKLCQTFVGPLRCWDLDDITLVLERPGTFWDYHLKPAFDDTPCDGWAIDLGANIGFFTRYLAQRFEKVLAVEAHPATCELLLHNVDDLRGKVIVVSGAAYDRHTTLETAKSCIHGWPEGEQSFANLDTMRHAAGITFVEDPAQQHELHEWKVQTVIMDELVPLNATVRLLKIDVQGAALRALYGCEKLIARCRPRIVWEYEGHVSQCRGDDFPDYERFFAERDYTSVRIPGPWADYLSVPR